MNASVSMPVNESVGIHIHTSVCNCCFCGCVCVSASVAVHTCYIQRVFVGRIKHVSSVKLVHSTADINTPGGIVRSLSSCVLCVMSVCGNQGRTENKMIKQKR